jgi:hypothetical protein
MKERILKFEIHFLYLNQNHMKFGLQEMHEIWFSRNVE